MASQRREGLVDCVCHFANGGIHGRSTSVGGRTMRTHHRWQSWCLSAGLALVLVSSAGTVALGGEQPGAKLASPPSVEEATRIIDLRKFPLPDDGKDLYKSADVPKGDIGRDLHKSARELYYHLRR